MFSRRTKEGSRSSSSKGKRVAAIGLLGCAFLAYNNSLSTTAQRRLKCEQQGRKLAADVESNNKDSAFTDYMLRLLASAVEDPCYTDYPPAAPDDVAYPSDSVEANKEPAYIITDLEPIPPIGTDGNYEIVPPRPDGLDDKPLDENQKDLLDVFPPESYDEERALLSVSTDDAGTIAYTVALTGCAEWYPNNGMAPDMGAVLYEQAAVLKTNICEKHEYAVARALKENKNASDTQRKLATDLGYQMHALIHPMANICPVQGTYGDMYDRTKLFQSMEYNVELLGHPIIETMLYDTQPYIVENIESDVGIRDSMKLNIWKMTTHPAVVLFSFDTLQLNPITTEIDTLLADPALKGYYVKTAPDASTGGQGVDTSFLIVKPSEEEFNNIVNAYVNTPFDPVTGWNGQGYHNFKGGMGISGFLAYYFANNAGYQELDRCRYAFDSGTACVADLGTDFSQVNSAAHYQDVCGDPQKCPYDDPSLPPAQLEFCHQLHKEFYGHRYQFEEKYFNKNNKQKRIGLFKQSQFLGYCREPGTTGQLPITGDVVDQPTWQTVCPPEPCPAGTMKKPDCTCTAPENPCDACPEGTYCQTSPVLMCIDCNCGFCDASSTDCCKFNNVNNCRDGPGNNQECAMQNSHFPAFEGSGNICGGVEISRTAVPNGCGCKPQQDSPCTYNPDWAEGDEKCFICNAADLAAGKCDTCKDCMSNCSSGACMNTSLTIDDFVNCMESINDPECRANCHHDCMKN
jgi:hypothetical protein